MKLATIQTDGIERVVGVDTTPSETRYIDLQKFDTSLSLNMRDVLGMADGLERCRAAFATGVDQQATINGTLLAPVPEPQKVICIGLNYRDHAIESGMDIPTEPVCFGKFSNTIAASGDEIRIPKVATQVDYEAELVIVIGKRGHAIAKEDAFAHVAGYCNGHDVSARDWQIGRPGKQWLLGKTPDTFAPIGPWIVTSDDVPDPHNLNVELRLNGTPMQNGSTKEFIFGVDEIIAHLSSIMTLEPGDVIFTGTPAGVGMGREPQVWLKPGDEVEVEIEGLGVLQNRVAGN